MEALMDLLQVPDGEHPFGDEAAETAFRKLFGEDHFQEANRLIWTCHHYDEIPPVTTPVQLVVLIDDLLNIYDRWPEHLANEKKLQRNQWRKNALQDPPFCLDASLAEQLGNDPKRLSQWLQDHYPHLIAVFDKSFEDPPYEPFDVYDHVRRHLRSRVKRTDGHFENDHCWGQPLVAWEHFPDAPGLAGDAKAAVDELRVWAVKKAAQTMGDNGLITRPNGTAKAVMHEETLRLVGDGAGGTLAATPAVEEQAVENPDVPRELPAERGRLVKALVGLRAILARGPKRQFTEAVQEDVETAAAIQAVDDANQKNGRVWESGDELLLSTVDAIAALLYQVSHLKSLPAPPLILRGLDNLIDDCGGPRPTADRVNAPEGDSEDGPAGADGFRYGGKVYAPLARGPFRALSAIWQSKDRCLHSRDLPELLYGDREEELNENTLRGLRGELNGFFRHHAIPYKATVRGVRIAIKTDVLQAVKTTKRPKAPRKKKTRR
jgi:hypothetical protein